MENLLFSLVRKSNIPTENVPLFENFFYLANISKNLPKDFIYDKILIAYGISLIDNEKIEKFKGLYRLLYKKIKDEKSFLILTLYTAIFLEKSIATNEKDIEKFLEDFNLINPFTQKSESLSSKINLAFVLSVKLGELNTTQTIWNIMKKRKINFSINNNLSLLLDDLKSLKLFIDFLKLIKLYKFFIKNLLRSVSLREIFLIPILKISNSDEINIFLNSLEENLNKNYYKINLVKNLLNSENLNLLKNLIDNENFYLILKDDSLNLREFLNKKKLFLEKKLETNLAQSKDLEENFEENFEEEYNYTRNFLDSLEYENIYSSNPRIMLINLIDKIRKIDTIKLLI